MPVVACCLPTNMASLSMPWISGSGLGTELIPLNFALILMLLSEHVSFLHRTNSNVLQS